MQAIIDDMTKGRSGLGRLYGAVEVEPQAQFVQYARRVLQYSRLIPADPSTQDAADSISIVEVDVVRPIGILVSFRPHMVAEVVRMSEHLHELGLHHGKAEFARVIIEGGWEFPWRSRG